MSNISSDNPSAYYRDLGKIQNSFDQELKRNRQKREEQIKDLEARYKEDLQNKDHEIQKTVDSVRKAADDGMKNERDKYEASLERVKEQAYNNKGVIEDSGKLLEDYSKQIHQLESSSRDQIRRNQETQDKLVQSLEHNHQTQLEKKSREAEQVARNQRTAANETFQSERDKYQGEIDGLKRQIYNNKGQISNSVPVEVYNQEIENLYNAGKSRHDLDSRAMEDKEFEALTRMQDQARKNNNHVKELTERQQEEVKDLQGTIKELNSSTAGIAKKKAEELANAIRENDATTRREITRLNNSFGDSLDKIQQNAQEHENYKDRQNKDLLKSREKTYANLMEEKLLENRKNIKGVEDAYKAQFEANEKQAKEDRKRTVQAEENMVTRLNEGKAKDLEHQAVTAHEGLERLRKADSQEIGNLKKALEQEKKSHGTKLRGPVEEDNIRRDVVEHYEKGLNNANTRAQSSVEAIEEKYSTHYKNAVEELQNRETAASKQTAQDRSFERAQYLDAIQEKESVAKLRLKEQNENNEREKGTIYRNFATLLDRQKKEFEHILESFRSDADSRLATVRQESEIAMKVLQRSLNGKQNELIRDYEKKLANQKTEYDIKIEDLRNQALLEQRDSERRFNKELEAQAKGFEQRLAQMDQQAKERERYISSSYQDEIERTKRSYELLNKKKG